MAAGHATNPPPRASWWHERGGLLASGLHSPSRFPSGIVSGGLALKGQVPVTVAGPRRTCTGFRVSPFVFVSVFLPPLVYRFGPPTARDVSSRALRLARWD
jgi:hypothetical protein